MATCSEVTDIKKRQIQPVTNLFLFLLLGLTWGCDWLRGFLIQLADWFRERRCGQRRGLSARWDWTGWRGRYWRRNQQNQFLLTQKQKPV